jgi:16S rRNA (uracil1498-N3)-methyltransferase
MNLLLFSPDELASNRQLTVSDRRFTHLTRVLNAEVGDNIKVGQLGGNTGVAQITEVTGEAATMHINLTQPPPAALPLAIVLALPRPKMLRRIFQTVASIGVKELHLINSYRVEKSFWQSPFLKEDAIRQQLCLGLEQSMDTVLPTVQLHKRFKPFVEDNLTDIVGARTALVAHPYDAAPCPTGLNQPAILAIGPEGGFIPYEIEKLKEAGFDPVSLGERILRVETAIPVLVSRLCSDSFC